MQHPDHELVGAYATFLIAGHMSFLCVAFLLFDFVARKLAQIVPSVTAYCIDNDIGRFTVTAVLATLTVAATVSIIVYWPTPLIIFAFGWEDYMAGLQVENKFGLLSDGSYLPAFWAAMHGGLAALFPMHALIPLTAWLVRSGLVKPNNESYESNPQNGGQQNDAPERRSPSILKWRITCYPDGRNRHCGKKSLNLSEQSLMRRFGFS